jgi:multidrug efflux pump subunit AcrB
MRLSDFAVKNWQFTVVMTAMLVAMGLNSLLRIPRSEDPTFPIATFPIVAVYPGASPADVEKLVVDPIEDALGELEDVRTIKTRVEDGLAVVLVEFDADSDADRKYEETLREVNTLRPSLPADLRSLEVERTNAADVNIVQLALVSGALPYRELEDQAERLEDRVESVPGVREAEVWAAPEREVRVSLDLGRLSRLGIAPAQVLGAIGSESANVPGGSVDAGGRKLNVKTSGDYTSLDEVRNTVVGGGGGPAWCAWPTWRTSAGATPTSSTWAATTGSGRCS